MRARVGVSRNICRQGSASHALMLVWLSAASGSFVLEGLSDSGETAPNSEFRLAAAGEASPTDRIWAFNAGASMNQTKPTTTIWDHKTGLLISLLPSSIFLLPELSSDRTHLTMLKNRGVLGHKTESVRVSLFFFEL